ncbi:glycoside hydrolase family 16 protein [Meredithblackwellia eburnea MCA 4105]
MKLTAIILAISLFSQQSHAKTYKLQTSLTGTKLINAFNWENKQADNGGVAYYQSYANAKKQGLVSVAKSGAVTLRVSTQQSASSRGSVRLVSKATFNSGGLWIFDVPHIPTGCGGWPALWFTGSNWPNDGEIDVIEGVHHISQNSISTHTGAGCKQQTGKNRGFTGNFMMSGANANVCDAYATNSQGCGVRSVSKTSYGQAYNAKGGGVYAMEWTSAGIKVFHWTKGSVPADIRQGKPNPAKWGVPDNFVASKSCNPFTHFKNLMLVINTNLCGVWGSGVWNQDLSYAGGARSCSAITGFSTCEAYVRSQGKKLGQMYWTINSIKIYK